MCCEGERVVIGGPALGVGRVGYAAGKITLVLRGESRRWQKATIRRGPLLEVTREVRGKDSFR